MSGLRWNRTPRDRGVRINPSMRSERAVDHHQLVAHGRLETLDLVFLMGPVPPETSREYRRHAPRGGEAAVVGEPARAAAADDVVERAGPLVVDRVRGQLLVAHGVCKRRWKRRT